MKIVEDRLEKMVNGTIKPKLDETNFIMVSVQGKKVMLPRETYGKLDFAKQLEKLNKDPEGYHFVDVDAQVFQGMMDYVKYNRMLAAPTDVN